MGTSSDSSRPGRPTIPTVLAGAVIAVLIAAWAPAGAATSPIGYDVAFPQCHEAASQYPAHPAFAIVGVNGGALSADNPCLGPAHGQTGELAWAASSTGLPTQPGVSFYVIASDPGPGAAGWPTGTTRPARCAGDWSQNCAYDYGYLRADSALRLARSVASVDRSHRVPVADPIAAPWWLDVETGAKWATGTTPGWASVNIAALAGFLDGLVAGGVRRDHIGFYSTTYQWQHLTTLGPSTSRVFFSPVHSDWVPGARTLVQARSACSPARSFSGGPVTLTQYASGGFDADYRCP